MTAAATTPELERLLRWVDIVTYSVQGNTGIANDELVRVEASALYNLLQAKEAYLDA